MSRQKQLDLGETAAPALESVEWWLAEEQRAPLDDGDTCHVRGDVLSELLRVYRERAKGGA